MSEEKTAETVVWERGQEPPAELWERIEAYRRVKKAEVRLAKAKNEQDKLMAIQPVPDHLMGAWVKLMEAIDGEYSDLLASIDAEMNERHQRLFKKVMEESR